jgi:hypothetical protein
MYGSIKTTRPLEQSATKSVAFWNVTLKAATGVVVDVQGTLEYTGYITFSAKLTLKAASASASASGVKAVELSDVRLVVAYMSPHEAPTVNSSHAATEAMVGLGARGSSPADLHWRWHNMSGDNMFWRGTMDAGVFVKLRGAGSSWDNPLYSKDFPIIPFVPSTW